MPELTLPEIQALGKEVVQELGRQWNTKCQHGVKRHARQDWSPYTGPRGGKGWKNNKTGYVYYGSEAPGDDERGRPEEGAQAAPKAQTPTQQHPPGAYGHDDYLDQAMGNLHKLSRTAQGTLDTSASAGKAEKLVNGLTGEQARAHATENFSRLMSDLHKVKGETFTSPATLMKFVDSIAARVNQGITKEGQLNRTDDSEKFPYTAAHELPEARKQFADELFKRLNDPKADPIETAGWVDWRMNLTDHFYADGVGKASQALGAFCLMRGGMPLPKVRSREETFKAAPKEKYSPANGADSYTKGPEYKKWQKYYHSLFRADILKPVRDVEQKYPAADPKGTDTFARHRTPDGNYTPERQKLHQEIVAKARGSVPAAPKGEQTYTLMGGGPASGKSSIIHKGVVTLPHDHVMIDSDRIKGADRKETGYPGIPEYNSLVESGEDRAAGYAHEESSDLAKRIQSESLANGQHTVLDGTGDNNVESVMKKVQEARKNGYKVHANYVTCSTETAVKRNLERGKKTGRMPAESMLRQVHSGVSRVLPELLKRGAFDNCNLYDTEDTDFADPNSKPELVMSQEGNMVTIHNPAKWKAFLAKAEEQMPEASGEKPSYYARF